MKIQIDFRICGMLLKEYLMGKFIALNGYIRRKKSQINDRSTQLKKLEMGQKIKCK